MTRPCSSCRTGRGRRAPRAHPAGEPRRCAPTCLPPPPEPADPTRLRSAQGRSPAGGRTPAGAYPRGPPGPVPKPRAPKPPFVSATACPPFAEGRGRLTCRPRAAAPRRAGLLRPLPLVGVVHTLPARLVGVVHAVVVAAASSQAHECAATGPHRPARYKASRVRTWIVHLLATIRRGRARVGALLHALEDLGRAGIALTAGLAAGRTSSLRDSGVAAKALE